MARNFYKNLFEENMTPQNSTAGMRTKNTMASPSNFEKGTGYSSKPQEGNVPGHNSYPTKDKEYTADADADAERARNSTAAYSGAAKPKADPGATKPKTDPDENSFAHRAMTKAREYAGAAKDWVETNPGKATAIGAATAAGLGALAFRKKIAEKLRKNK